MDPELELFEPYPVKVYRFIITKTITIKLLFCVLKKTKPVIKIFALL
jgi:hypothetical protein